MKYGPFIVVLTFWVTGLRSLGAGPAFVCDSDVPDICAAQRQESNRKRQNSFGHLGSYADRIRRRGRQHCEYVVGHDAYICY